MRYTLLVAALAATVATPALAQQAPVASDTAQAYAKGVVLQNHELLWDKDLDFGVVTVDNQGGTVSISADALGTRTTTLGATALSGTYQAATFLGKAAPNETVQLTITPPNNNTVKDSAGNSIPVVLTVDAAGLTRQASATGQFTVYVGGTFTLAPNQAAGVYSEVFYVKADYQ
jgi:Domain of unknown function (DUF4402)